MIFLILHTAVPGQTISVPGWICNMALDPPFNCSQSVWVISPDGHWNTEPTCIISAQVASWTMCFSSVYETNASPPHVGESATDHQLLELAEIFPNTLLQGRCFPTWSVIPSCPVDTHLVEKYIERFSNFNGKITYWWWWVFIAQIFHQYDVTAVLRLRNSSTKCPFNVN